MDETRRPFLEHLGELRKRILYSVLAVLACSVGCLFIAGDVIVLVRGLLPAGTKLHTFTVGESLFTELKVAILMGLVAAGPFIAYQVWAFIEPGLYGHEKGFIIPLFATTVGLFAAGAAFCWFVALPAANEFLLQFGKTYAETTLRLADFLSFALWLMLAFGIVFEIPVLLYFLGRIGAVNSARLRKFRRFWIPVAFVIAAILTPTPDVVNQLMMAVPMCVLYEVGVLIVARLEKKKAAQAAREAAEDEEAERVAGEARTPGTGSGTEGEGAV